MNEKMLNFDPLVKYRNALIASARNIRKFQRKAGALWGLDQPWSRGMAKSYEGVVKTLLFSFERNDFALHYFFETKDVDFVADQDMQPDITVSEI